MIKVVVGHHNSLALAKDATDAERHEDGGQRNQNSRAAG